MSAAAIHDPTHAYRSGARKLRGQFADRPAELYRSLRQHADHHDLVRSFQAPIPAPATPTSEFAAEVREFLRNGMLTYSTRQNLLKSADTRGIPRFEANLIIAAVQHRIPPRSAEIDSPSASRLPIVFGFVISQLLLLVALWALVAR